MIQVLTYECDQVADSDLMFAVISAKYEGKWIFCRHKARQTWEIPGGHREIGEPIEACARRELYEETGALVYDLTPICAYSASDGTGIGYGMFYYAEVTCLGEIPSEFEIGEIRLCDTVPQDLTYPEIQGVLFDYAETWLTDTRKMEGNTK